MSPLKFITLSGRLVRVMLYVVAAGAVVFFALTRTEVGREGLRDQLERQFARSFDAELDIRELKGNLLNRLSAGGVVLTDAAGRSIATVDSIVIHPSWRDLFNRTISTGSITLINPQIHLRRHEDGSWNVRTLLNPSARSEANPEPWSFRATRVQVRNGRIVTENEGDPPTIVAEGAVFDYANAELRAIDGRAVVDWGSDLKLIDILELDGQMPETGLAMADARGQIVLEDNGLSLNELHLQIGASNVYLNGSIGPLANIRQRPGDVEIEIDIKESVIDASELARLAPALPLRDVLNASARIRGPFSALVVEEFIAARGQSVVAVDGTVLGLPDSLDYELAIRPTSLTWTDVEAVWPDAPLPPFDHLGTVDISGYSDGLMQFASADRKMQFRGAIDVDLASGIGRLVTNGTFATGGDGRLQVRGTVEAERFDVGRLLERPDLAGQLSGLLNLDLEGSTLDSASGSLSLALGASEFASRSIDTMNVAVQGTRSDLQGTIGVVSEIGALYANISGSATAENPRYRLEGRTSGLDLGSLLGRDSLHSSIQSRLLLEGHGASWGTLEGDLTLVVDTSRLTYGRSERIVPSHETRISVRQLGSETPRIEVGGDLFELMVTGDVALAPMIQLSRQWTSTFAEAIKQESAKSYRDSTDFSIEPDTALASWRAAASAAALASESLDVQRLTVSGRIVRPDLFSRLLRDPLSMPTNGVVSGTLEMNQSRLHLTLDAEADSLHVGSVRSSRVAAHASVNVPSIDRISETIQATVSAGAERLRAGGQLFTTPEFGAEMRDKHVQIDARAGARGAVEPFQLVGRLALDDNRNRLTVDRLQLPARDQTWRNPEPSVIDFFHDAVVVRGLRMERSASEADSSERFYVEGRISESPQDTLVVEADDILLEHVASMLVIEEPIGGRINGRLAVTGLRHQPELTGSVRIAPLTYENRVLGAVSISSHYLPGSPDVALRLQLRPDSTADSRWVVHENAIDVDGTFRLPGGTTASGARDPGSLDLEVAVRRAEAFFFEYIFRGDVSDVSGYLTGRGHIGGSLGTPLFEADLELHDGAFDVPEFNLSYAAAGPVSVDQDGIHLREIRVSDATGGEAAISGSVLFNDYRYFSFDLRGALTDLPIMNVSQSRDLPFYGRIWASGDVSLTGPLSSATLHSENAVAHSKSDLYIPITETAATSDAGFIVFADSVGRLPNISQLTHRQGVLSDRPEGERPFLDGLEIELDISAPQGSTVHLVIDPLLGDVINAVGSGRIQLIRSEGDFSTFGSFNVSSGDYLFTAGEVFFRRFLIDSGTITWDGDPLDAMLNIAASYQTRASPDGLGVDTVQEYIPLIIRMNVTGRVSTPSVDLALAVDRSDRNMLGGYESSIEAQLNQPEHVAEYATSVLLTNSFLLTTSAQSQLSNTRNQLAFNSLSQLVASQLNRYLNYALPNLDLNVGVQGESTQDIDVTYGVALRLLDERLVIRGEGMYQSDQLRREQQGVLDEFVVEVRLNPSVSVEVFYRREGDPLDVQSLNTSTTGAGVSYQTDFPTWRGLFDRVFGWLIAAEDEKEDGDEDRDEDDVVVGAGG